MTNSNKDNIKTVLVAPLGWGLGHAARCIPIIKELLANNTRVILAGSGPVAALLSTEFPDLELLTLSSFPVKYPSDKKGFLLKMIWQVPAAIKSIKKETAWLKQAVKKYSIDAVISDNRMGLYSKEIPCIYITHQLLIKTGKAKWMERWAQKIHYRFINRFKECWVPDFEQKELSLAGELSHPENLPNVPVKYIGALSRLIKKENAAKKYDTIIILSGPEPQRSIFENILVDQLKNYNETTLFIRGLPAETDVLLPINNTKFVNHLTADELSNAIASSEIVISRTGYTTVMDLIKLNKKAILVPTPGQPEQEYLAGYLLQNNIFYTVGQENFNLPEHIEKAGNFNYRFNKHNNHMDGFKFFIKEFNSSFYNQ